MSEPIKPIQSDHPGDWHWERFIEFSKLKAAVGEPTPHMRLVQYSADKRQATIGERLWMAGCYGAGYSYLTGEALWREWPFQRVQKEPEALLPWLNANWNGIHTRTPRRCVRTPEKFYRNLMSYLAWMRTEPARLTARYGRGTDPITQYEAWWGSLTQVDFMGRYIAIRLLELYRRWNLLQAELFDIRAIGAHSPIRCLCLLYPAKDLLLRTGDPRDVDAIAEGTIQELRRQPGLENMRHFDYAAILCEYRSSYENRGDYPGNQTDEELGYQHTKYAFYWEALEYQSEIWEARRAVCQPWSLGELHGWTGQRKLAARALRDFGINWDDQRFDYLASVRADRPIAYAVVAR